MGNRKRIFQSLQTAMLLLLISLTGGSGLMTIYGADTEEELLIPEKKEEGILVPSSDQQDQDNTHNIWKESGLAGECHDAVPQAEQNRTEGWIAWDESWEYASYSAIHTGMAYLYRAPASRGIVVAVNAGHGTAGGTEAQTLCHPDQSPKVTGGSTGEGAIYAMAVSNGTTLLDGTPESQVTLSLARLLKDRLLQEGFDVLMIRNSDDVQLDNIARTVLANQVADCHLSLHYDSTETDKGFFFISVPNVESYLGMEPVASHYQQHMALGNALLSGAISQGIMLYGDGTLPIDLTQTSYSTIPSVDVEVGDRASDYSPQTQGRIADAIVTGVKQYFGVG